MARSGCQNAVLGALQPWGFRGHATRPYLRGWLYDGSARAAPCQVPWEVAACFAPLLRDRAPGPVHPSPLMPAVAQHRPLRVFQLDLEQAQRLWHRGYTWTLQWTDPLTPGPRPHTKMPLGALPTPIRDGEQGRRPRQSLSGYGGAGLPGRVKPRDSPTAARARRLWHPDRA